MAWRMEDAGDQQGKTILVTGSNTGIGFTTAQFLARAGANVIMACRNRDKGEQALAALRRDAPSAKISLLQLDLASLASVREAAAALQTNGQRLDVLINNAGVMMPPLSRTADGFETQFGTNVLGHFALTGLLLPLLELTPGARVVWLSSIAHWQGRLDFGDLNAHNGYSPLRAYAQSKLADLVLAYEMQRRLERAGSATISLGAHPGVTQSDLGRHRKWLNLLQTIICQSVEAGAMPSLRAAVGRDARGSEYYGPALAGFVGAAVKQGSSRRARDAADGALLWQACEQLTKVRYLS